MEKCERLVVVKNFDGSSVTWSDSFCDSAKLFNCEVVDSIADIEKLDNYIFLGDKIPKNLGKIGCSIYFLAAADRTQQEYENVIATSHTTTVSNSEKTAILDKFPNINSNKISVDGFPINLELLNTVKKSIKLKMKKSVCFLGRTDSDKGPHEELIAVEALKRLGYSVFHLANCKISIYNELSKLGAIAVENLNGLKYLNLLATMGCVVNTSPRESLFVSGLEATGLGLPIIAPSIVNSGINDWNLPNRFYRSGDIYNLLDIVREIELSNNIIIPSIDKYDHKAYFNRQNDHFIDIRQGLCPKD